MELNCRGDDSFYHNAVPRGTLSQFDSHKPCKIIFKGLFININSQSAPLERHYGKEREEMERSFVETALYFICQISYGYIKLPQYYF